MPVFATAKKELTLAVMQGTRLSDCPMLAATKAATCYSAGSAEADSTTDSSLFTATVAALASAALIAKVFAAASEAITATSSVAARPAVLAATSAGRAAAFGSRES